MSDITSTPIETQSGTKKSTKQIALALMIITDVIIIIPLVLAMLPIWMDPLQFVELGMSWILIIVFLSIPSLFFIKIGWPEKIKSESYILPLRLGLGFFMAKVGIEKLTSPTFLASSATLDYAAFAATSPFIQSLFLALAVNWYPMLLSVAIFETIIGITLLCGVFTRLSSLGGTIMMIMYFIMWNWGGSSTYGINMWGAVAFFAVGMHQAGRYLGLDQILGPKMEASKNSLIKFLSKFT